MLPSIDKIYKFFKLEIERGFDNRAVVGGLEKIMPAWEVQARTDHIAEEVISALHVNLQKYSAGAEDRCQILQSAWGLLAAGAGLSDMEKNSLRFIQQAQKSVPSIAPTRTPRSASTSHSAPRRMSSPTSTLPRPSMIKPPTVAPTVRLGLSAPLTVIQGVGQKHAETLAHLGLNSLEDLLFYFPRRYDDYSELKPISRLFFGEDVTIIGTIKNVQQRMSRSSRSMVEASISDGSGEIRLTWFNQPWVAARLQPGAQIVLSGRVEQYLGRLMINNPEWEPIDQEQLHTNRIVPVYPLTASITQRWLRRIMFQTISYWSVRLEDFLPAAVRDVNQLPELSEAIQEVHFPSSMDKLREARKRLAFDEIFLLQLGVLGQKSAWQKYDARVFTVAEEWMGAQVQRLPYELTGAQQKALLDIRADLSSGKPMNRLLQGDVGSGKTVVAALASAIINQAGAQAAFLAPTSILAEQHYRNLSRLLADPANTDSPMKEADICLLIGATPASVRKDILDRLSSGSIRLIIGTHALLEEPVKFNDLQLAVIDEQHRFGVEQRANLRAKGTNPHLLVMTATPIPRSLALTVYGDLDLTVIDEFPVGRQRIDTSIYYPREREVVYDIIRSQIAEGRQVFIIYPLVQQGENDEAKAAVEEHARLSGEVFPGIHLGLLHGRLKQDEKDQVMQAFRNRELDILVSTSVVEVGVDIPNATIMLIEGANRFGLSQLHQFRGRVGRGAHKSFCFLIPENESAADNQRLQAMVETDDGFVLAEKDLEQRGPGDFLGKRQAGFSDLRMASLTDVRMIEIARKAAQKLFAEDPELSLPQNEYLANTMRHFWDKAKGDIS
jgi:ATP-dependent DNA helicase RecG